MLISFLAFEEQMKKGKIAARLYSDLIGKALSTRPQWKMVEENVFERNIGERIEIKKADTLADIVLSVILIEMREFIMNDNKPEESLAVILDEFKKFFSSTPEKEVEEVIERNQERTRMLGAVTMRKFGL